MFRALDHFPLREDAWVRLGKGENRERSEGVLNLMKRVQAVKGNLQQKIRILGHNSIPLQTETFFHRAELAHASFRKFLDSEWTCCLGMGHFPRADDLVEFLFGQVAQFQSGLAQTQMFTMRLMSDLRRLVVPNFRAQRRHQH